MNEKDILTLACTRRVLKEFAAVASGLERDEATKLITRLQLEFETLSRGDIGSKAWTQVSGAVSGPQSYGLQRIGLFPDDPFS